MASQMASQMAASHVASQHRGPEWSNVIVHPYVWDHDKMMRKPDGRVPPWSEDLKRLRSLDEKAVRSVDHGPNFDHSQASQKAIDEHYKYKLEKKSAWKLDQMHNQYGLLDPEKPIIDQLNPLQAEHVVRITPGGPDTKVYKYGKQIGYLGPMGEHRASIWRQRRFHMQYQWTRLSTCQKVAIGILIGMVVVSAIITVVITSLEGACNSGALTDVTTCRNLGISIAAKMTMKSEKWRSTNSLVTTTVTHLPCAESVCANGGTCLIKGNIVECICFAGFAGKLCEINNRTQTTETIPETSEAVTQATQHYTTYVQPTTSKAKLQKDFLEALGIQAIIIILVLLVIILIVISQKRRAHSHPHHLGRRKNGIY